MKRIQLFHAEYHPSEVTARCLQRMAIQQSMMMNREQTY